MRRPHWLVSSPSPTPTGPLIPVASFTYFLATAMSTTAPAFFVYRNPWPSLYCEARQEIIPQGPGPVLETAHTLGEANVRAAADRFAENHGA